MPEALDVLPFKLNLICDPTWVLNVIVPLADTGVLKLWVENVVVITVGDKPIGVKPVTVLAFTKAPPSSSLKIGTLVWICPWVLKVGKS